MHQPFKLAEMQPLFASLEMHMTKTRSRSLFPPPRRQHHGHLLRRRLEKSIPHIEVATPQPIDLIADHEDHVHPQL